MLPLIKKNYTPIVMQVCEEAVEVFFKQPHMFCNCSNNMYLYFNMVIQNCLNLITWPDFRECLYAQIWCPTESR